MNPPASVMSSIFWHRTRRQFVEVTAQDVMRKLNCDEAEAIRRLTDMTDHGYARRTVIAMGNERTRAWQASIKGEDVVRQHLGDVV